MNERTDTYFNRDRSANRSLYEMFYRGNRIQEVRRSPAVFRKRKRIMLRPRFLRVSKVFASFFFDAKARLWRDPMKGVSEIAHFLAIANSQRLQRLDLFLARTCSEDLRLDELYSAYLHQRSLSTLSFPVQSS